MVLGDENVGKLMKSDKKPKKRKKSTSSIGLGVTKGNVKAIEHDLSFKEEQLSLVILRKERDTTKMVSQAQSEYPVIKAKKEKGGGKQPGKSSRDGFEDAIKNDVKDKNKLKNEWEAVDDTPLDTKRIAHESETQETKVVKRKKRKKEKQRKGDRPIDIVAGVNQGDFLTIEDIGDSKIDVANCRKRKKTKQGGSSDDVIHEKSEKRVKVSCHVQVFPPSSDPRYEKHEIKEENLLQGKRFTCEEDEIVKGAVYRYIEEHNLGEEGLQKVLESRSHPELKGCWKTIGMAIPYRPYIAVYRRAQRLFRNGEKRKWTEEELEMLRKLHGEHGPKWKALADQLGRHYSNVENAWNRIKLANRKRGIWAQEEIQTLFDLVNTDLQLKLNEEKKSMHGMLRDNICWRAISDRLSTRICQHCCAKWYQNLTSSMVATGEWADTDEADTDDYRLIDALFELDSSCIEDVDWDNLLDRRSGELCRKRWNQMVRQLSKHEGKSFAEQVEVLAKRYRPDLVGARETWDSKPVVQ